LLLSLFAIATVSAVDDYIVGANDVLNITVFEQPQLTGRYIVQADGTFTFPLLGRLKAGGLSMQALENELRDRLLKGGFWKQPQVGVSVEQYRSQQIFVMGEVRQPGLPSHRIKGIIEALARANSQPSTPARRGDPPIDNGAPPLTQRQSSAQFQGFRPVRVNLQNSRRALANTSAAGDTILCRAPNPVFVSGQVRSAGEYVIRNKGMTVRQALTLAGGVTERGSTRRIQIIRRVNGVDTTVDATLQDTVRPGDTIVVRESFF
jgi:polysaccharide export outer membrane protein